jgi:hypothetical protein
MVKLFAADLLVEKGLECDCCVSVVRIKANVYAGNETQARELIKASYSDIQIRSLEDKGEVNRDPGINIIASDEVFRGYYRSSPLYVP